MGPQELVEGSDQGQVPGEVPVHHLAVRELHRQGSQQDSQRGQHPGREHCRQRRDQGSLPSLLQLGQQTRRGAAPAGAPEVLSTPDVLDQRCQHLVLQVQEQGAREEDQDRGPLPWHVQGPGSVLQQPRVLQRLPVCSGNQNEPGEEVRGLVMTETMMMMMMMMMMMVTAVMRERRRSSVKHL